MTTTMPTTILQDVADRQAIVDLISRLGYWLDDKRFDDARSILADDATVQTPGGSARGIDAVTEQARRNHVSDRTHHVITNVLAEVDGDRATAQANLVVTFVEAADQPAARHTRGQRYRLQAIRTSDGWRLSRIEVAPVWTSDDPGT